MKLLFLTEKNVRGELLGKSGNVPERLKERVKHAIHHIDHIHMHI